MQAFQFKFQSLLLALVGQGLPWVSQRIEGFGILYLLGVILMGVAAGTAKFPIAKILFLASVMILFFGLITSALGDIYPALKTSSALAIFGVIHIAWMNYRHQIENSTNVGE
jgi:hypothetical protein